MVDEGRRAWVRMGEERLRVGRARVRLGLGLGLGVGLRRRRLGGTTCVGRRGRRGGRRKRRVVVLVVVVAVREGRVCLARDGSSEGPLAPAPDAAPGARAGTRGPPVGPILDAGGARDEIAQAVAFAAVVVSLGLELLAAPGEFVHASVQLAAVVAQLLELLALRGLLGLLLLPEPRRRARVALPLLARLLGRLLDVHLDHYLLPLQRCDGHDGPGVRHLQVLRHRHAGGHRCQDAGPPLLGHRHP